MSLVVVVLSTVVATAVLILAWRLGRSQDTEGGGVDVRLLRVHVVVGAVTLVPWLVLVVLGDTLGRTGGDVVGIIALAGWWVTAAAGLAILVHLLRADGASVRGESSSVLVHLGMLVCVGVFTWAYATGVV